MRTASEVEAELTMDQHGESSQGSVTDEKKVVGQTVNGVDDYESDMPDMYAHTDLFSKHRHADVYAQQLEAIPSRPG